MGLMVRNDKTEAHLGVSPRTLMSEREVAVYLRASVRTIINERWFRGALFVLAERSRYLICLFRNFSRISSD